MKMTVTRSGLVGPPALQRRMMAAVIWQSNAVRHSWHCTMTGV